MRRVYLDTNILAFIVGADRGDSLSLNVREIVYGYETLLLTSSVCLTELVHLIQIGKVRIPGCKDVRVAASKALSMLKELGIQISPITLAHVEALVDLPFYDDHRDPNDRLIISQAIADKIPLVSSDRKFEWYRKHGLEFVFNER